MCCNQTQKGPDLSRGVRALLLAWLVLLVDYFFFFATFFAAFFRWAFLTAFFTAFFAAFLVAKVIPLVFGFLFLEVPLLPAAFFKAAFPPRGALDFFAADFNVFSLRPSWLAS